MTAPPTDPHWELKTALAQIHDGLDAFYAAVVNGSYAELARQQLPVLKAQETLDRIGDLRNETALELIVKNHATIRDIERQLRELETRMDAIELDWIAQQPPEA